MQKLFIWQVIKNPVTDHLPTGCMKIGTSCNGELVDVKDLVPDAAPVVFVIGAMAHGSVRYSDVILTISMFI